MARPRKAAATPPTADPTWDLRGLDPASGPLGKAKFQAIFDELLKRMEPVKPHSTARELEERISVGEAKIGKALKAAGLPVEGDALPDGPLGEAIVKLRELRAELERLNREYIVPHSVLHLIWYLLNNNGDRPYPLTADGEISVNLPGILRVSVAIPTEPPF